MESLVAIGAILLWCAAMTPVFLALDWYCYKTDPFYRVKYGKPTVAKMWNRLRRGE